MDENGRVTTREFYEQQIKTNELIGHVKDDIMAEITKISVTMKQVEINNREIEKLRERSNIMDGINAFIAVIAAAIAAMIGSGTK